MTFATTFEETKYENMQKGLNLAKQKWKCAQIAGGGGLFKQCPNEKGFFLCLF